ncbi:hypothetical protein U3516DRAFT_849933 [Neocallimastix sp. 'constans']
MSKLRHHESIKKTNYYLLILVLFHLIIVFLWLTFNSVSIEHKLIDSKKEYLNCKYPQTKILCYAVNSLLLLICYIYSYIIRNVDPQYKEPLNVPIYLYLICISYNEVLEYIDGLSINIVDFFNSFGTLCCVLSIYYYFYINKFKIIYQQFINKSNHYLIYEHKSSIQSTSSYE